MIDPRWHSILSTTAWMLYSVAHAVPDGEATIEELCREFHTSKTAIRRAIGELEERGLIIAYQEES